MSPASLLVGALGFAVLAVVLWDAFETILVPRRIGRRVRLTRYFYVVTWRAWRAVALGIRNTSRREALLGFFGPLSLVLLLALWAFGLVFGFTLVQLAAIGGDGNALAQFERLLYMSGETFFTLGFGDVTPATGFGRLMAVIESGLGFGFLGTVVGYLPTMYSAFAQRETEISLLDARAGSPPTVAEFLRRGHATAAPGAAEQPMRGSERWAAQLLETHISYPQLAYYRSQHSNQSWLGALVVILDSAAVILARSEPGTAKQAKLTFAMARHALVDITQIFVPRYRPGAKDRLPPETLAKLRAHLAETPPGLPATAEFEARLSELRLLYEPYAQALAGYLLIELPPWIQPQPRRDNWRGGPWDRKLGAAGDPSHPGDDHF